MEKIIFEDLPSTNTPINANNLNTIQENVEKVIEKIENNLIDLTGKILWINPNPTIDFEPQTITLSSSDYDCYEVIYKVATNSNNCQSVGKIPKGYGTVLTNISGLSSDAPIRTRSMNYVSDNSFIVNNSYVGNSNTSLIYNNCCIPIYFIGYKTGLF